MYYFLYIAVHINYITFSQYVNTKKDFSSAFALKKSFFDI